MDEQKRHNSELADNYYQLLDIIQAWKLGGKIKDDANDLSKVDSLLSTYNHPAYEQLVEEYKSFREAVRAYPERKELSGLKDEVAPLVTQLTAKANLECTEAGGGTPAPSRASSGTTTPPLPPAEPTYRSQLKLELPSFSGDLLEWREFWHLFSARIERETGLSECEKIGCLESAMSSAEAKDIVRHASITGKYDDVVAELKGHYDKVKLVNKHHVNQLLSLSPVGDDHESLVLFKRTLNKHIGGIQACRGDSFEQFVTTFAETLLGRNSLQLWAEFTSDISKPPPLSAFLRFLDRRIDATQTLMNTNQCSNIAATAPKAKTAPKPKPRVLYMKETPSDSCPACDGEHSVYQCSSFKALSVNQRLNLARKKHLCFNCLGRGHSLEACPSKRSCRACGAKHHTFIHQNSSPSTSSTTSANEDSSQVLFHRGSAQLHLFPAYIPVTAMATVTAGAQQQQARVLLDSGSGITIITSCLANSLKAKRVRVPHSISSLHGW